MKFLLLFGILLVAASTGSAKRVVCYYTNWSIYRHDPFKIDFIDPKLCTHVVYSFAGLDHNGNIILLDPWNDLGDDWTEGGFKKFQKLRTLNPAIKLMIGVGGWNEGATKFQSMVRNPQKRKVFLESSLAFLRRHQFDGLEIAWVFQDSFGGTLEDKLGYSELVKEMRPKFQENRFILSASTSANKKIFENSYDIAVLSKYLDFINIMSYDLHGSWDGKTGHVAPLHAMKSENVVERLNNVEEVVKMYIEKGAAPETLNLGTVGYGRTFTLVDPNNFGMNSPTRGAGRQEPLLYVNFCRQDLNGLWRKFRNEEQAVPYAVSGDQWVGYEDAASLVAKAKFAKLKKLGGVTFWSLDNDDFNGVCSGGKYPLLRALTGELGKP